MSEELSNSEAGECGVNTSGRKEVLEAVVIAIFTTVATCVIQIGAAMYQERVAEAKNAGKRRKKKNGD